MDQFHDGILRCLLTVARNQITCVHFVPDINPADMKMLYMFFLGYFVEGVLLHNINEIVQQKKTSIWGFYGIYWGMANDGYNSREILEGIQAIKILIRFRVHHSWSVIKLPVIGLKPYDNLLSIHMKSIQDKYIFFMMSGRLCECGTRTCTSISPPY